LRRFILLPEAKADLRTASHYYDAEKAGLGKEFLADFHETIARVVAYPLAAPVVYKDARKARLSGFHFDVFYLLQKEDVLVFAVMHQRRHPDSWKKRI
jgi:toxin ParE1/3/4